MTKNYLCLTLFSALFFFEATAQCTPPTLEVSGTAVVCSENSAILTATTNGQEVRWYDAEVGGTQLGTGTTFETEPVTGTTSFWAEARFLASGPGSDGGGKLAPTSSGSATVNPGTAPWGLVFTATQGFILNSVDVFLSSGTPGTVVILFKDSNYSTLETFNVDVPAGGSASSPVQHTIPLNISVAPGDYKLVVESGPAMIRDLSGGNTFPYPIGTVGSVTAGTINDEATNLTSYYFLYNWNFSTLGGGEECISERLEFEVTTTPSPQTPDDVELTVCEGTTIADTDMETETLNWYGSESSITPLSNSVVLQNDTTYYVAESNENCESARAAIMVTVTPAPDAPMASNQDFCGEAAVADLSAEGETIFWYDVESGGEPLAGDTMLMSDTYYASQVTDGCESDRTAVEITIYEAPEAPEIADQDFCSEAIVANLEGEDILWYDVETDGEPLEAEIMLVSGIYYAALANGSCESSRTAVEVNVYDIPDLPDGETEQEFDEGETLADLIVTGENLNWFADMEMQSPLSNTTELIDDTTYYVTQTINGCMSEPLSVTVSSSLGINDASFGELKVYPNPTNSNLTVINTTIVDNISIYTLVGQKVFEKKLSTQNTEVNLSTLSAGTYLLKLEAGDAVKTLKIVKQ